MELRFRGQFNRDIDVNDKKLLEEVKSAIQNIEDAKSISQIQYLKKLKKYKTLYRIEIAKDYRIGVIIRGNVVWFTKFGHRNNFYKYFP